MILSNYQLNPNLSGALERYERDNNLSPILLVENLLKKFLYDEGYLVVEEDVVETPTDIYNNRKNKFVKKGRGKNCALFYDTINFGYFKKGEVDTVIEKLLSFSDEELKGLDKNNWEYSERKYKPFLRAKLDNPSLTVGEFLGTVTKRTRKNHNSIGVEFLLKTDLIARFPLDKYSDDVIHNVESFLDSLSYDEIVSLINERKRLKQNSAKHLLRYMSGDKCKSKKFPYVRELDSGRFIFNRKGYTFGTHDYNMVSEVYDFLVSKEWDKSYSTKETGLRGKSYLEWFYSEIEKEKGSSGFFSDIKYDDGGVEC